MPSLREFSKRIVLRARNISRNADNLVRKVALTADQIVVAETPVDKGRARSNWIVSLGNPASQVIDSYVPGEAGSTGGQNTQAALDQGEAVIRNYQYGQEIHITNNLEYIQPLNEGHSRQADPGYVQNGVRLAAQEVERAYLLENGRGG